MRYEYIEPFVNSTIRVLDSVTRSDTVKGAPSLSPANKISGDISIIVRLSGDSEGSVIVNTDSDTALRICNKMNGSSLAALTPLGMDSIAELANMIAGNAASALNELGFDFKVSPPVVVTRENFRTKVSEVEAFRVPLFTECGEVTIHIALKTD